MDNFFTDVILKDPHLHSPNRVAIAELLEPVTRAAVARILADSPYRLLLFETFRSKERQEKLFLAGATRLRAVGTHFYGVAADIVRMDYEGHPSWKGDFTFLRLLAEKNGLISGANWGLPQVHHSFVDPCHVQRITLFKQASLFSGKWYPDESYDPTKVD